MKEWTSGEVGVTVKLGEGAARQARSWCRARDTQDGVVVMVTEDSCSRAPGLRRMARRDRKEEAGKTREEGARRDRSSSGMEEVVLLSVVALPR